jgi:hypothetical protein
MAKREKKSTLPMASRATGGRYSYLTKRITKSAARRGVQHAAAETLHLIGYNVIAQNGWVVKKYVSGKIVRIARIQPRKKRTIVLD